MPDIDIYLFNRLHLDLLSSFSDAGKLHRLRGVASRTTHAWKKHPYYGASTVDE